MLAIYADCNTFQMIGALQQLLNGQIPDEIIWTADISYWLSGQRALGNADPDWDTETGYLRLCNELGIMPYYWYDKFWLAEPVYEANVTVTSVTTDLVTLQRWETPIGYLEEESRYLPISGSTGVTQHAVQDSRDLDVLLWLLEHRDMAPSNIDDYNQRLDLWVQHDGLPSIALTRSPLSSFLYEWAGVQNGIYLLADEPEKVRRILGLMEEQETAMIDAVCKLSPPLAHFADNLSSDNLTSLYDRYMAGPHRKRLNRLHDAGVRCAVHLDGTVAGLLPRLIDSGFDAIEALTPYPAGDLTVEQIKRASDGADVILWGGVPGVMFAPPYTWDDMRSHVMMLLQAWRGSRFIVGVADQVPPDGDISFCRLIADLIESDSRKYR